MTSWQGIERHKLVFIITDTMSKCCNDRQSCGRGFVVEILIDHLSYKIRVSVTVFFSKLNILTHGSFKLPPFASYITYYYTLLA